MYSPRKKKTQIKTIRIIVVGKKKKKPFACPVALAKKPCCLTSAAVLVELGNLIELTERSSVSVGPAQPALVAAQGDAIAPSCCVKS